MSVTSDDSGISPSQRAHDHTAAVGVAPLRRRDGGFPDASASASKSWVRAVPCTMLRLERRIGVAMAAGAGAGAGAIVASAACCWLWQAKSGWGSGRLEGQRRLQGGSLPAAASRVAFAFGQLVCPMIHGADATRAASLSRLETCRLAIREW